MDKMILYGIIAFALFLIWLVYILTRNNINPINQVIEEQ